MLVVIWLLVTSHHLVPGWSLAGLWLVISPHRLSQCVPVSESRCDGVWHWTQQTENCHHHHHHHHHHLPPSSCCWNVPEAVRPWGELFVFKDTREAPGLGTPVLSWRVSPARHWLLANKDITGVTGRQEEERRASTSKLWAATFPSVLGLFMFLTFKPTSVEQIQRYKMLSDEGIS